MSSKQLGSRMFRRVAASIVVGLLLVPAIAATAVAATPLTVTMTKEICPSYTLVPANVNPDNMDATGNHWRELDTTHYTTKPVTPSNSTATGCTPAAGWTFDFTRGQTGPVISTYTTGADGTVTEPLNADELALARSNTGLWVLETTQTSAGFGSLRCYNDMLNGDNSEQMTSVPDSVTQVWCFAYNVAVVPSLTVTKTPSLTTYNAAGQTITYTYTLQNTGNVALAGPFSVSDAPLGTISCVGASLAVGATTTCATASYTIAQADLDANKTITNTATGHGSYGATQVNSTTVTVNVTPVQAAAITVTKTPSLTTYNAAGQTITYTYTLQNTGNVTLTSPFTVTDVPLGTITCVGASLAVGATTTCNTASYATKQTDLDANSTISDTATGHAVFGGATINSTPVTVNVTPVQNKAITVTKTPSQSSYNAANQTITYTYTLQNTGNVTLASPFTVTDSKLGSITCIGASLAVGATTTCATASYTTTQADLDANKTITNTATGHGNFGATQVNSTTVTVNVTPVQNKAITVTKTPSRSTYDGVGETITYTYTLQNTGNVTLTGPFTITDVPLGAITCVGASLAPGATIAAASCNTKTYTTQQTDFDAGRTISDTATGHASFATTTVDSAPVTVNVKAVGQAPALTIDKTAKASYGPGDMITYSYLVTNTGNVTINALAVSDDKLGAITCPVSSLAPAAFTTCTATHLVSGADLDLGSITNTATADGSPTGGVLVPATDTLTVAITGQAPALSLKKTSDQDGYVVGDTIDYTYLVTNTGNVAIGNLAVTDDKLADVTCPATPTTLNPGDTITCTATYKTVAADVGKITNNAKVTGDPPTGDPVQATDSRTVTVTAATGSSSPSASHTVAGESGTPPPTGTSSSNGSSGNSTPVFALLICFAFGTLALVTALAQRRRIKL